LDEEEFGLDSSFGDVAAPSSAAEAPPPAPAAAPVAAAPAPKVASSAPVKADIAPATVPVEEKKAAVSAEAVDVPVVAPTSTSESMAADEAKRAARAAKFGIPLKPVIIEAPKKDNKQQKKKGGDGAGAKEPAAKSAAAPVVPAESAEQLEKKRQRAERFGIQLKVVAAPVAPGGGAQAANGNKKNKIGNKGDAGPKPAAAPVVDEEAVRV
jgi:resuscitation-promoting factor RpfA